MTILFETERTQIRKFTLDDVPALLAMNSDPEVIRYAQPVALKSLAETEAVLKNVIFADYEQYGYGRFAVVEKASNDVIGFTGIKHIAELNEDEIGYRLLPQYWGKGLATEVNRAAIQYAKDHQGKTAVIALIIPENKASIRVAEKLGMENTGLIEVYGVKALRYRKSL